MLRVLYLVAVFLFFPVVAFAGQKVASTDDCPGRGDSRKLIPVNEF